MLATFRNFLPSGCVLLAALLFPSGLVARENTGTINLRNESLFSPAFFPALNERSESEVLLAGLSRLYPKQVLAKAPPAVVSERKPPRVEALAKGTYIRVYDLTTAVDAISTALQGRTTLVLDLRFVHADAAAALSLGSLLSTQPEIRLDVIGSYEGAGSGDRMALQTRATRPREMPVFVLTNTQTSGALEAVLDDLKSRNEIISVGLATAGMTGAYRQVHENPAYFVIRGEVRSPNGGSLLQTGFVPTILADTTPEQDRAAYLAMEEGVAFDSLIASQIDKPRYDEASLVRDFAAGLPRQSATLNRRAADAAGEPADPEDLILQKVFHIYEALVALGKIPQA